MRRLLLPFEDAARHLLDAAEAVIESHRNFPTSSGRILVATFLAWWIYVPIHELLHALGCVAAGGRVTELQIAPFYGGRLLGAVFPFVHAGGEHAGRLSGFDTRGSDLTYLATDLAPYTLTIAGGFPLLRRARQRRSALLFGCGAVLVAAPLMGMIGDYFEMAGVLASDLLVALGADASGAAGALRCDDLPALLAGFPGRFPEHRAAWSAAIGGTFLLDLLLVALTLAVARLPGAKAAP